VGDQLERSGGVAGVGALPQLVPPAQLAQSLHELRLSVHAMAVGFGVLPEDLQCLIGVTAFSEHRGQLTSCISHRLDELASAAHQYSRPP
jgi:hypothetical protein